MTLRVTDSLSNRERHIAEAVRTIGRSIYKRKVFEAVYYHKKRIKSVSEIMKVTGLSRVQVLQAGVALQNAGIVEQSRGGEVRYSQIPIFQSNKKTIFNLLDSPERRKKFVDGLNQNKSTEIRMITSKKRESRRMSNLTVLYLTATPDSQDKLRVDAEIRMVQREIRGAKLGDSIQLHVSPAADMKSMLDGLNDHKPDIVHFSGHGGAGGIWVDDGKVEGSIGQSIDFSLLGRALRATTTPPKLVVLNACDTLEGAEELLKSVQAVIAMSDKVSDLGAATFAAQFYAAIASRQPLSLALEQGKISLEAATLLDDADLPTLICGENVDAAKLVLV